MQKERLVEPYVHQSIKEVNDIFGAIEANKKVVFVKFWQEADKSKTVEVLTKSFNTFFSNNNVVEKQTTPTA